MRSILFLKQTIQGSQFRWYFLKNKNFFQDFFLNVWNKVKILNIFKKKMALIADAFPKLRTPKNAFSSMSQKSRFRGTFEKQDGERVQTLSKFERQHTYHIYWSLWGPLSCKKSLLVIRKTVKHFVNTVTADDKYSLVNRDNLTQPIQIQLSQKENLFSWFFSAFLKSSLNFEHFQQKDDPHSRCFSKITDSKKRGFINL